MGSKHRYHVMRAVVRESVMKWRASTTWIIGEMISALELPLPSARATNMMATKAVNPWTKATL